MTIGIIGFGTLGRQILGLLSELNADEPVAFFDDLTRPEGGLKGFAFNSHLDPRFSDFAFYLGLGYKFLPYKARILSGLRAAGRNTPSFVHPTCHVHHTSHIGDGCVVYPKCNLDQSVEIGNGTLLHNSVVVSHNSVVGEACYLSPGVVLAGSVTVGAETFLGAGTIVSNGCSIGRGVRVGIGSVITQDVPDGASVIGNPIRTLDRPLNLV